LGCSYGSAFFDGNATAHGLRGYRRTCPTATARGFGFWDGLTWGDATLMRCLPQAILAAAFSRDDDGARHSQRRIESI